MKKKSFYMLAIVAIVASIGFNIHNSLKNKNISDLALANIEALASSRESSDCPHGCLSVQGSGCWCYSWHQYNKEDM